MGRASDLLEVRGLGAKTGNCLRDHICCIGNGRRSSDGLDDPRRRNWEHGMDLIAQKLEHSRACGKREMEKGGLGWLPFVLLCIHHYLYPRIERLICDVFMAGLALCPSVSADKGWDSLPRRLR